MKKEKLRLLQKAVKSKKGFTLIELVATVAIMAIVATLSFQAIFMASEEYRRANQISACQRAVSLMQKNLNEYSKTASDIEMIDGSAQPSLTAAVNAFKASKTGADKLQDADNIPGDKYNDYIFYCTPDPLEPNNLLFRLSKYDASTSSFKEIFSVSDIKEMAFEIKSLTTSANIPGYGSDSRILDYTITSPTGFEIINKSIDVTKADSGEYSVMSGIVLNNIDESATFIRTDLKIGKDNANNFIHIRTLMRT